MGHSRWYGRIYDRIVIQTDNMEVIKLLQNEENWLIEYVPRNENRKANSITKLAFNREEGL
ncbi:hypothetical protein Gohar_017615 [Gossypium harknessii]|uniref:RNase H type-1 domain-containing protein n=1 Tax=Gossypium harknessii TaxID=34285 RepID=A0A7J9G8Q7_9ROSI|nr:hypothetical protein [Gossypium harknessii]